MKKLILFMLVAVATLTGSGPNELQACHESPPPSVVATQPVFLLGHETPQVTLNNECAYYSFVQLYEVVDESNVNYITGTGLGYGALIDFPLTVSSANYAADFRVVLWDWNYTYGYWFVVCEGDFTVEEGSVVHTEVATAITGTAIVTIYDENFETVSETVFDTTIPANTTFAFSGSEFLEVHYEKEISVDGFGNEILEWAFPALTLYDSCGCPSIEIDEIPYGSESIPHGEVPEYLGLYTEVYYYDGVAATNGVATEEKLKEYDQKTIDDLEGEIADVQSTIDYITENQLRKVIEDELERTIGINPNPTNDETNFRNTLNRKRELEGLVKEIEAGIELVGQAKIDEWADYGLPATASNQDYRDAKTLADSNGYATEALMVAAIINKQATVDGLYPGLKGNVENTAPVTTSAAQGQITEVNGLKNKMTQAKTVLTNAKNANPYVRNDAHDARGQGKAKVKEYQEFKAGILIEEIE